MCQNGMSVPAHPSRTCFYIQDTLDPNYLPQVALPVLLVGILWELENMSTGGTPAQHVMQVNTQKQLEPPRQPPARTVKQVKEAESAVRDCEADVRNANIQLVQAEEKKEGPASPRMAKAKVREFMATGRNDIDERRKFNRWIYELGLALLIDPKPDRKKLEHPLIIGIPKLFDGRLVSLDQSIEDAAGLGLPKQSLMIISSQQS